MAWFQDGCCGLVTHNRSPPSLCYLPGPTPFSFSAGLLPYHLLHPSLLICFCSSFAFTCLPGYFLLYSACQVQRQPLALPWKWSPHCRWLSPLEAFCFHLVDSLPTSFQGLVWPLDKSSFSTLWSLPVNHFTIAPDRKSVLNKTLVPDSLTLFISSEAFLFASSDSTHPSRPCAQSYSKYTC